MSRKNLLRLLLPVLSLLPLAALTRQNHFYQNYFTSVLENQILKRSNLRFYFANVKTFGDSLYKSSNTENYNRVGGIEFTNISNFNINTKFQWRYRPTSDFFLVYTSNYVTPDYRNTGYNFTMKIVYWLN